jgi:hypothetical protein
MAVTNRQTDTHHNLNCAHKHNFHNTNLIDSCPSNTSTVNFNKTGDVRINLTLRRVRVTIVAVEMQ